MTAKAMAKRLSKQTGAYRRAFLGDDGNPNIDGATILADLKKFCRADKSTTMVSPVSKTVDPLASAQAEGRREVWLRIVQMLYLDDRIIAALNDLED
jgi:hypothetical protein